MVAAVRLLSVVLSVSLAVAAPALAQQRGSISGKVLDPDGLALPGATVVITNAGTGFTREAITAETGAYSVPNLEPGTYDVVVTMAGFGNATRTGMVLSPGSTVSLDLKLTVAGVQENLVVTGESPLVERTSNQIGGSLSRREIEEVPSNFRNFTGLTQLIPGMTPNPATSTFEGGQVVANGSPSQQNVYLLDGMYNNDDRLGGSQGTQVRVVLDNIEEYQVLANQYSSEYGGGAGAIINMVTRGGTNDIRGRVYSYFRDESLNARGLFLPDILEKAALGQAKLQTEADYRTPKGLKLKDEYSRSFQVACAQWRHFGARTERADLDPAQETLRFVHELLRDAFGYTALAPCEAVAVAERVYPVSLMAGTNVPVVVAPHTLVLDEPHARFAIAGSGSRRKSAFQLAQELLNASPAHRWALVSNGRTLRLLRDAATLTRPSYLEIDLQDLLGGNRFAEFAMVWRLLQASRAGLEPGTEEIWERWREAGQEEGTRVFDLGVQP